MTTRKDNIDTTQAVVYEGLVFIADSLFKEKPFNSLGADVISEILLEVTLFIAHICDREIFCILGSSKRDIIMDEVLANISNNLENHANSFFVGVYKEQGEANQQKYYDNLLKMMPWKDLQSIYNERQIEYSSYKELVPEDKKALKNTLVWEASKKIANLVDNNPATIMNVYSILSNFAIACKKTFKTILDKT